MKIAYVSFEVAPLVKVGGLADVAGALPKYIKKLGEEIYVIMPFHKAIEKNCETWKIEKIKSGMKTQSHTFSGTFDIYETSMPDTDLKIYLIKNDSLFGTEEIYGYKDLAYQSSFFCDASITLIKEVEPQTGVVNVNDWQTSLISVYLKTKYRDDPVLNKIATVLTIHNLGFKGEFTSQSITDAGLPSYLFNIDALEFYGSVNFLKGGIIFSDIINTVSKTYAEEIQTEEYGLGMDGVLRIRSDKLFGITNGIDYEIYDPKQNRNIYKPITDYESKMENKARLQKDLGLNIDPNAPVISFVGRLYEQKGLDIMNEIMDYLMLFNVQFVILGRGDPNYESIFKNYEEKYKGHFSANIKFDSLLAQQIYAGSDIFLMPSRYEPCGLGQMYAMRYGTVPVVRYTGGLADTVREYYPTTKLGTGFGFYDYEACRLLMSVAKALYTYSNSRDDWERIFENCMSQDFSYENTARQYKELYKIAVSAKKKW